MFGLKTLEQNESNDDFDSVSKEHVPWFGETSIVIWVTPAVVVDRDRLLALMFVHDFFAPSTVSCAMTRIA
jgi:hypothetical protein